MAPLDGLTAAWAARALGMMAALLALSAMRNAFGEAAASEQAGQVEVIQDVPFLPEALREKMRLPIDTILPGAMDIYIPKGLAPDARRPAVVVIHGGGWAHRRRREPVYVSASTKLAESGFVAASIDYMLAPMESRGVSYLRNMASSFPRNLQDVKSAVRFLRANASKYQVDPDRIATMGSSAGGHLAALAAVTQAKDGFEPTDDGLGGVSSAVQACVSYYGPHDWSKWGGKRGKDTEDDIKKGTQASTITHLDKDDPPMLVFHGNKDITVSYAQSQILVARLKELGVPHEFVTIENKGHGTFYTPARSGIEDHEMVVKFLTKHLSPGAGKAAATPE